MKSCSTCRWQPKRWQPASEFDDLQECGDCEWPMPAPLRVALGIGDKWHSKMQVLRRKSGKIGIYSGGVYTEITDCPAWEGKL